MVISFSRSWRTAASTSSSRSRTPHGRSDRHYSGVRPDLPSPPAARHHVAAATSRWSRRGCMRRPQGKHRGTSAVKFRWRRTGLAFSCAVLAGCASAAPIALPRANRTSACTAPAPDGELLLGVALSGGGSRAAIFGAATLEALSRVRVPDGTSVLERIGYVSSVSGGSLAASYYAKHKPGRELRVLTSAGDYSTEYEAFFRQYRQSMAQNFQGALIRRQFSTFRWLNSALTARSLEEVLKERLLGDLSLGALTRRQLRGDIP